MCVNAIIIHTGCVNTSSAALPFPFSSLLPYTLWLICRVGQNRIYTLHMTVYLMKSLQKIPCIHRIYVVLANPTYLQSAGPWSNSHIGHWPAQGRTPRGHVSGSTACELKTAWTNDLRKIIVLERAFWGTSQVELPMNWVKTDSDYWNKGGVLGHEEYKRRWRLLKITLWSEWYVFKSREAAVPSWEMQHDTSDV